MQIEKALLDSRFLPFLLPFEIRSDAYILGVFLLLQGRLSNLRSSTIRPAAVDVAADAVAEAALTLRDATFDCLYLDSGKLHRAISAPSVYPANVDLAAVHSEAVQIAIAGCSNSEPPPKFHPWAVYIESSMAGTF